MTRPSFTQSDLLSRHKLISEAGTCPDCESPLVAPKDTAWPHENCPSCGSHYLADTHPGYRRLIQSFPIPGRIKRNVSIDMLYDERRN